MTEGKPAQPTPDARLVSQWEDETGILVSTHTRTMLQFFARWLAKNGRVKG